MRSLLLAALGITAFSATMAVETPEANAVVYCAAGVYRAGCVVRPGVASVRGVARRTTRRVVRRSDISPRAACAAHRYLGCGALGRWARPARPRQHVITVAA